MPSGVADHVRVAGLQSQAMLEQDAGIHAGQHGHVPLRADCKIAQLEIARELLVGF